MFQSYQALYIVLTCILWAMVPTLVHFSKLLLCYFGSRESTSQGLDWNLNSGLYHRSVLKAIGSVPHLHSPGEKPGPTLHAYNQGIPFFSFLLWDSSHALLSLKNQFFLIFCQKCWFLLKFQLLRVLQYRLESPSRQNPERKVRGKK